MFSNLSAATWGEVGKAKEKGFFDFDYFHGWLGLGKLQRFLFLLRYV